MLIVNNNFNGGTSANWYVFYQQQQQQHKLYLHDYNYVVTVLQKLQHKVTIYNNDNAMQ